MESPHTNSSQTTADTSFSTAAQDDTYYPEEEVTEGNWKTPKVNIVDVKIVTGEEDENIFWSSRAKLYRWKSGEWKQRGLGEAKLLENKNTGKIRFLLRQEKTFKIVANHYVLPSGVYCKLSLNSGSDKIWVWAVLDYAEETVQNEQFAIKFRTVEQAEIFKNKFEEACEKNLEIMKPLKNKEKISSEKESDSKVQSQEEVKEDSSKKSEDTTSTPQEVEKDQDNNTTTITDKQDTQKETEAVSSEAK